VSGAIEALDEPEREALLLRHFEDATVDEIAERLGRSPSAVRRLLGRAAARLGDALSALEGGRHGAA
jgi:RNA polymerase sigma factor (sigma-70 family)